MKTRLLKKYTSITWKTETHLPSSLNLPPTLLKSPLYSIEHAFPLCQTRLPAMLNSPP